MKKLLLIALAAACVLSVGCSEEVKKSTVDYDKYKSSDDVSKDVDYTYYNLIGSDLTVVEKTDAKTFYFDTNVKKLTSEKKYSVMNYVSQSVGDFVAFNYIVVNGEDSALESGHVAYKDDNNDMPENAVTSITLKTGGKYYVYYASNGEWKERKKSSHLNNVVVYETGNATAQYSVKADKDDTELYMETVDYSDEKTAAMFFDTKGNLVAEGYYKDGKAVILKTAKVLKCDEERLAGYVKDVTVKTDTTSSKS